MVNNEINALVESQRELEGKYQSVLVKKLNIKHSTKNASKLAEVEMEVLDTGRDLKNSTHVFGRSLRQNPLTGDNISKIQDDR